jgi:aspartate dehydrogenase
MKVALVGFGAIGREVARHLADDARITLAAVVTREAGVALEVPRLGVSVALDQALDMADVIVDCATPAAFPATAETVIAAGRTLVTVNSGTLAAHERLFAEAERTGARIILPAGAAPGLDAILAAAVGGIHSVRLVTRKPPGALPAAPGGGSAEVVCVFRGSAREAVRAMPQNMNIAATISFAGIGLDRTEVEVWADPATTRNHHTVTVDAKDALFTLSAENRPSPDNPKTSLITAASVVATLRQRVG